MSEFEQTIELVPSTRSVREARRFIREQLESAILDVSEIELALLAANELVTNAVVHARTDFRVTVRVLSDLVRVEVSDENPSLPFETQQSLDATSGRGMSIIEGLSIRWGVDPFVDGKTVWLELARPV